MPDLLLELGCEELPASFVRKAFEDLRDALVAALREERVLEEGSDATAMGTPRRLIVEVKGLKDRQEDLEKETRGPALKAAYTADGEPTPALLGFCRSAGIEPSALRKDEQYVWAKKLVPGRSAQEVAGEAIAKAIRSLSFEKSMRWGEGRMRFARPIRWILASLGGALVPIEIEGVSSGLESRGRRFVANDTFPANDLKGLLSGLRERQVEPDPEIRRELILSQTHKLAVGTAQIPEALLEENVFLTEWPVAVAGHYRAEYEELPSEVLVTAMAKHEKMFPVTDDGGKLTNQFIFIRNSGEDDTVRSGAEWVLNARFNDAKFFFDEDRKTSLDAFLEKTQGIVFHAELGTVRQRAERLAALAARVAEWSGAGAQEIEFARLAGLYAKADLSTGLVSELPALQGIVGGHYARRHGLPAPVCHAIKTHYDLSKNLNPDCEGARTAVRLLIADQIDRLTGYLGKGMAPTGSSDPYALRRAATQLIEAAWTWPTALPAYDELFSEAIRLYMEQGFSLKEASATDLFASRYVALLEARHDVLEAATASDSLAPRLIRVKLRAMEQAASDRPLILAANRCLNILAAAKKKQETLAESPDRLDSAEGEALLQATGKAMIAALAAQEAEDPAGMIAALGTLEKPVDAFFESTMVMAEDPEVRSSRLGLVAKSAATFLLAGDFSRLVVEG